MIIDDIKKCLTTDLLRGRWKQNVNDNITGHCYVATEALYWILGGKKSTFKPYVLSHRTCPELLEVGETHWFLMNPITKEVLDPTSEQFNGERIPYEKGIANGMMNHPIGGSKRARKIIDRICNKSN